MTSDPETRDDLMVRLAALPARDVDELRRERTRQRAHRVLARHRRRAQRMRIALGRFYNGVLEPVLVCSLAGVILVWAFNRAAFLLG